MEEYKNKIWMILIVSFLLVLPFAIKDIIEYQKQIECEKSNGFYIERENKTRTCIIQRKIYVQKTNDLRTKIC